MAADTGMAAIASGTLDCLFQERQHAGIALVEVERDDLAVAIDAERELGQIVRTDRRFGDRFA